jgi:hypothetical protein
MKIFVATPCHRCTLEKRQELTRWSGVLLDACKLPGQLGIVENCPWLDCARADLVAAFLQSDCTHLLFRDDDIEFDAGVLRGLLDAGAPIASAPYKNRTPPHVWVTQGLGAVLIERRLLEWMVRFYPELRYMQDGEERCGLFHHMFYGMGSRRVLLKEDAAFFKRLEQMGYWSVLVPAAVTHGGIQSVWPDANT